MYRLSKQKNSLICGCSVTFYLFPDFRLGYSIDEYVHEEVCVFLNNRVIEMVVL